MQQAFAVETVRQLALSATGTAAAVGIGLGEQLSVTHSFLNLDLPYWFFLLLMVLLNFIGAYFATTTDYMKANGTKIGNFFTAVLVGFILSFVVLPVVNPSSSVGLMLIASFISGLCGTILLRVIINIINREDLQEAVVDLVVTQTIRLVTLVVGIAVDHAAKIMTALMIGIIASLAYTNNADDKNSNSSLSQAQTAEVLND